MQKAFSATLVIMCIGALLMIGLSLSAPRTSAPVEHIANLARRIRDASTIVVSAVLALFLGAVIAFIIIEKRQTGGQRILRRPAQAPSWVRLLCLALVLLAFLAATYTPPAEPPESEEEPEPNGDVQEVPVASGEEPDSEDTSKPEPPLVMPSRVTAWPWWKYGLLFAVIVFVVVMGIAIIGPRRSAVIQAPVTEDFWPLADMLSMDAVEFSDSTIRSIEEEPDPRMAVLMSYLAFLSALEIGGSPAESHHTPEECASNAQKVFKVPRRSLRGLISAYQRAFFSTHDVTFRDKAAALASLRSLKSHIDSATAAEAAESGRE
ncbi:MAG: DUF4129 domain-containing protein [Firmicutes bacterium]|nr:DUF4129 domain-containing protein [Bacillota bacterium]